MTFDQAQKAFREHKASKTADAYLENALHDNADKAIGDDTFLTPLVRSQAGCRHPSGNCQVCLTSPVSQSSPTYS